MDFSVVAGSCALVVACGAIVRGVGAALAAIGEQRRPIAWALALLFIAGLVPSLAPVLTVRGALGALAVAAVLAEAVARRRIAGVSVVDAEHTSPGSARAVRAGFLLLLAHVALTTHLWDEASTHLPLGGAVARELWPLEHPIFPGQPLRYHAGFAVLVGVVRSFTHLPLDTCVDVVAVVGFVVVVDVVGAAVVALAGASAKRTAPIAAVAALLLGGPAAVLLADGWGAAVPRCGLPAAWVNGATYPPLVVTNLFQHPQGLGLPLGLALLLLAHASPSASSSSSSSSSLAAHGVPANANARVRLVLAAVAIPALARVHIVVALLVGAGLVVRALARKDGKGLVALAAGAALVVVDSGFAGGAGALARGGYFGADGVVGGVVHNVLAFGVALGAAPLAVWLMRRAENAEARELAAVCGVLGVGGFVIANVVHYERSWDIVKFFGVSAFFAHIVVVSAVLRARAWHRARAVFVVGAALSLSGGGFWLLRHGPLNGVVAAAYREDGCGADVDEFLDVVGDAIPAHARVFAPDFLELARAGYLVPGTSWRRSRDTAALLLDRPRTEELTRAYERAARSLAVDDVIALGAEYVVVRARDTRRVALLQAAARAPQARLAIVPIGGPHFVVARVVARARGVAQVTP